jgi:hypothetical protein
VPHLPRAARQRVSAAGSTGPPRSHTRARAPGATGGVQLRQALAARGPRGQPPARVSAPSGRGNRVVRGRARASRRLAEVDGRRSDHECSSAVAAAQAYLDLARTGGSSRASETASGRGAPVGAPAGRWGAPADRRRSELCGLPDRSRVFGPKRARSSRIVRSQDPPARELPERQRPPLRTGTGRERRHLLRNERLKRALRREARRPRDPGAPGARTSP